MNWFPSVHHHLLQFQFLFSKEHLFVQCFEKHYTYTLNSNITARSDTKNCSNDYSADDIHSSPSCKLTGSFSMAKTRQKKLYVLQLKKISLSTTNVHQIDTENKNETASWDMNPVSSVQTEINEAIKTKHKPCSKYYVTMHSSPLLACTLFIFVQGQLSSLFNY